MFTNNDYDRIARVNAYVNSTLTGIPYEDLVTSFPTGEQSLPPQTKDTISPASVISSKEESLYALPAAKTMPPSSQGVGDMVRAYLRSIGVGA